MQITERCYELVRTFEGCQLQAYQCPAGVWTIGYGHTGKVDGAPVCKGMTITKEKAEKLLKDDLRWFKEHVMNYDSRYNWNQNELDALVSFAYNVGNIHQLTAYGTRDKETIAQKMPLYNKANSKVLAGLQRRREAEVKLFTTPVETPFRVEELLIEINGDDCRIPSVLIDGNNFVKLRDLCRALGLRVSYIQGVPVLD